MTDETSQTTETTIPQTFGKRLKSAREDLRLDIKDVASQLRLRASIIDMLEKEMYSDDTPITFLRGYLRSYAKFLEIPESELNSALREEPFQPKIEPQHEETATLKHESKNGNKIPGYGDKSLGGFLNKNTYTIISTSSKYSFKSVNFLFRFMRRYFMPLFTAIIIFTMGYLVLTWWNTHKNSVFSPISETLHITPAAPTTAEAPRPAVAPVGAKPEAAIDVDDQDMEATLDDEPAIFEDEAAPKEPIKAPEPAGKMNLSANQLKKSIDADIYNE